MNPLTHILYASSEEVPCELFQFSALTLDNKLFKINQLTGAAREITKIDELDIHTQECQHKLPHTNLQIFRNLIITNLTHTQIEMLKVFKSYHANHALINMLNNPTRSLRGGSSPQLAISIFDQILERLEWWKIIERIVS